MIVLCAFLPRPRNSRSQDNGCKAGRLQALDGVVCDSFVFISPLFLLFTPLFLLFTNAIVIGFYDINTHEKNIC
jgi:hypothetical protein